jgi:hypothetical protein
MQHSVRVRLVGSTSNERKLAQHIIYLSNVLNFYPPKFCFRILIQFLESKFSFSADISPFFVMIYNSKICIGIINTDLDSKLKLEF